MAGLSKFSLRTDHLLYPQVWVAGQYHSCEKRFQRKLIPQKPRNSPTMCPINRVVTRFLRLNFESPAHNKLNLKKYKM